MPQYNKADIGRAAMQYRFIRDILYHKPQGLVTV